MCDELRGVDWLVEEYLVHRGFTQTFRLFQREKSDDRTHGFHAIKIVEQIYHYIETNKIGDFIDLWDFLNKRFFMHLDRENLKLLENLKTDLIKCYLVNLFHHSKKQEMNEFFETYSHEIIGPAYDCSGNRVHELRSWYALPYMSEPDKDPEFGPYFSKKWADTLRITLHNFLSTILFNTPEPKLLFLEKWFRSDAQEETRRHLKEARDSMHENIQRENQYEDRIFTLQGTIRDLVTHIHESNIKTLASSSSGHDQDNLLSSKLEDDQDSSSVLQDSGGRRPVSDLGDLVISDSEKVTTLGKSVCELSTSCIHHSHMSSTHHHDPHSTTRSLNCKTQSKLNHAIEVELLTKIQEWLQIQECSASSQSESRPSSASSHSSS